MTGLFGAAGIVDILEEEVLKMNVMEWLTQVRKLDGALLEHMGVKERDHPQIGKVAAFPYHRGGKPYGAKFRAVSDKQWRSSQGVQRGLYNEDTLRHGDGPIVITEGEMDALSVMQAGYTRAVSLPDGWTSDGGKRDVLVEAESLLRQSPFVIVAGDNDDAGASLPRTVANILAGHHVKFVVWPDGCKDANDVLVKFGEGELSRCLTEAKTMDPEGGFITGISDLPPLPDRRVLRLGIKPFDYILAFEVGAMSVGTGVPGHGKSTFTTFAAFNIAMNENIKVGFLSFETHPHRTRDHLCRLLVQKPWSDLPQGQKDDVAKRLDKNFRIVHRTFEDRSHSLGWLRDMIYTLAVRDNCKLIIVDPWNELEHLPEPGESMTNYINFALQQIRQWAEKFDTHICLIAHPKKMDQGRSPTGYDVADSAAFSNKPALGFTVWQTELSDGLPVVQIITWKVRDTQLYGIEKGNKMAEFLADSMSYIGHKD
jgi:twinkle protein